MSQGIKERAAELASREAEIKKKLLGQANTAGSKASRVGKTALYGGITALLVYLLYKSFGSEETKTTKSSKKKADTGSIVTEKVVTFALTYIGKFLDNYLSKSFKKGTKSEESD